MRQIRSASFPSVQDKGISSNRDAIIHVLGLDAIGQKVQFLPGHWDRMIPIPGKGE